MIPEYWVPEPDIRLSLYARLSRTDNAVDLNAFEDELIDRFGALPPPAETLINAGRIGIAARALQVARIDAGPAAIALTPRRNAKFELAASGLIERDGRFILREPNTIEQLGEKVLALLEQLQPT
jgi:transcription-repair coupling factor (superfamily II helicase)